VLRFAGIFLAGFQGTCVALRLFVVFLDTLRARHLELWGVAFGLIPNRLFLIVSRLY
jgi:hypothetical protein